MVGTQGKTSSVSAVRAHRAWYLGEGSSSHHSRYALWTPSLWTFIRLPRCQEATRTEDRLLWCGERREREIPTSTYDEIRGNARGQQATLPHDAGHNKYVSLPWHRRGTTRKLLYVHCCCLPRGPLTLQADTATTPPPSGGAVARKVPTFSGRGGGFPTHRTLPYENHVKNFGAPEDVQYHHLLCRFKR